MAMRPGNEINQINRDWASDGLRNAHRQRLKQAMDRSPGTLAMRYTPEAIEHNIFNKARHKNEYIQMMSQIITRFQQRPPNVIQHPQTQAAGQPRINVPDLIQTAPKQQAVHVQKPINVPQQNQSQIYNPQQQRQADWNHQAREFQVQQPHHQQQQQRQIQQPGVVPDINRRKVKLVSYVAAGISPVPYAPAPRLLNSPGLKTPGSNHSAQSPASISMNAVPSPATLQQPPLAAPTTWPDPSNKPQTVAVDDKIYMEKLKQLQKYIEPLTRVIHKFNEDEEKHNKDYLKMKNLRDALMNPQKRMPWSTLEKCEKVLQRLDNKPKPLRTTSPHQHMCQSIFNTIGNATKFPLLSHTLKRTFGPSVQVLCGDYATPDVLLNKKMRMQEDAKMIEEEERKKKVPTKIIRELHRLRSKYHFKLDVNWAGANDLSSGVQILCFLMDHKLPAIPPIRLMVPCDCPDGYAEWVSSKAPEIDEPKEGLQSCAFHEVLLETMRKRQEDEDETNKRYITNILNSWEHSIKEACCAINKNQSNSEVDKIIQAAAM